MILSPRQIRYYAKKIIDADQGASYYPRLYYTLSFDQRGHIIIQSQRGAMISVPTPYLSDIHAIMHACDATQPYGFRYPVRKYTSIPLPYICIHHDSPHCVTIAQPTYRPSNYYQLNLHLIHHIIDDQATLMDVVHDTEARMHAHLAFMNQDPRVIHQANSIICRNESMQHYPHIYAECKILHNYHSKDIYAHVGLRVNDEYIDIIAFPITSLHATHMWQENIPKIFPLILRNIEQYVPKVSAHARNAFLREMQHYLNDTQHPMMQRLTRAVANMETYYISASKKSHQHHQHLTA